MERIMIALSIILSYILGCTTMIIYLNKKFNTTKDLLNDKILVNDLLKKEIQNLACCKDSKKSTLKNKRRNFRKKPKKQQSK
jgi:hypothetical protein|tara:strand:- start:188 stop:433 length:246 start_codon:yes stop_codon:yes gene_type:complete